MGDHDPRIFAVEAGEILEAELLGTVQQVLHDDPFALPELLGLIRGYAEHLSNGLVGVGFEEDEAKATGWRTAWEKLLQVLDVGTLDTVSVATMIDRNSFRFESEYTATGEPKDLGLRAFYRTFINRIDTPSIHPTAAWLGEAT